MENFFFIDNIFLNFIITFFININSYSHDEALPPPYPPSFPPDPPTTPPNTPSAHTSRLTLSARPPGLNAVPQGIRLYARIKVLGGLYGGGLEGGIGGSPHNSPRQGYTLEGVALPPLLCGRASIVVRALVLLWVPK